MELDRKRIVLTGASSGIGKELLEMLLAYDVTVTVGDLAPKKVKRHKKVTAVECDVSRPGEVNGLFKNAMKSMGGIDIFIANAGFAYYEKIQREDWDHIEKIYRTNFISPVYALEKMEVLNRGREYMVVITASAMGKLALPGYALYSSTKAALDTFISAYRLEHDGRGIISVVYPIATKTEFFRTAGKGIPVAWPTQSPATVARAIIKGIRNNRKRIFPSKLFFLMMTINRVLPFVLYLYTKMEQYKLKRWLAGK
jgi:uncharacterized protein